MPVAALYDIHGNLPALEAVLAEVREAGVDRVVVGGDVLPGPMWRDVLALLLDLEVPTDFIQGNCESAVLTAIAGGSLGPLPEQAREVIEWQAAQLRPEYARVLAVWPGTIELDIPGLGDVLFCHATPQSDTECFTRLTPDERIAPAVEGLRVVVCGHTHMPFDRMVGATRVVNAGSVGMPFGDPGADWLLLGPDIQLRHTQYDLAEAADRIRNTDFPQADEFATRSVLHPPSAQDTLALFAAADSTPLTPRRAHS